METTTYLEYVGENEEQYRVRSHDTTIVVPKDRRAREASPGERPASIRRAYHYLLLAFIGLLPAGLGVLIFGPLAAVTAFGALRTSRNRPDRRRALVVMAAATLLVMIALPLVFLFFLHW